MTPSPSAPPTCSYVEAKSKDVVSPEVPDALFQSSLQRLEAYLYVALDANGHPVKIGVLKSSGYPEVDLAAERAARQSTYSPAEMGCAPVPGHVEFDAIFARVPYHQPAAIEAPAFLTPSGWKKEFEGFTFGEGTLVGAWSDGADELAITAFTDDGKTAMSAYLSQVIGSEPVISSGSSCDAQQPAATASFDFALSNLETRSFVMRSVRSGRMVYTLTYSVPLGIAFDPAMLTAISAFCAPDHLRGVD
jgi:hypothetical protein